MRKVLKIYLDTNEEGCEVEISQGIEKTDVSFFYEQMRFIIRRDELLKALDELEKFSEEN